MNDAQLRALLIDCLHLWEVEGTVNVGDGGLDIATDGGLFTIRRADAAMRPVRWFYCTPDRAAAGRPPRAAPSVVALLSALRNAMEGTGGDRLHVAGG